MLKLCSSEKYKYKIQIIAMTKMIKVKVNYCTHQIVYSFNSKIYI